MFHSLNQKKKKIGRKKILFRSDWTNFFLLAKRKVEKSIISGCKKHFSTFWVRSSKADIFHL